MEDVVNPATGEVIAAAPLSTKADVDAAVAAAKGAFEGWAATPPGERARALLRIADLIEERGEEIADLEAADAGKPRSAVLEDEIPVMADNLRFFAGAARCMEGRAAGEYMEGHTSFIRREPVGVVGQITPWNYPLMMAIWKIGPALAAGNTVVLKPAETTPLTTLLFAEWCAELLPPGVLNVDRRPRRADRGRAGHPPRRRDGLPDRLAADRQVDRQGGRRHAQARPPRARRQGPGRRLRRRRHGDRAGDDRRHRLLQRRPGLHRGDPRARRERRLRRRRQRARRRSQGAGPRRHDLAPTRRWGRSTPSASASGSRASSSASRATPRSSPAASSPTCPASSSSRPSSPASSRATR